jgi:ankyrin repeat protein
MNGANYNVPDSASERKAVHAAAYNNNEECIRLLLLYEDHESNENNLLINYTDKFKRTALMIAVEQGHFNTMLFIIEQNADLNLVDEKKCTALHRAVRILVFFPQTAIENQLDAVFYLLKSFLIFRVLFSFVRQNLILRTICLSDFQTTLLIVVYIYLRLHWVTRNAVLFC